MTVLENAGEHPIFAILRTGKVYPPQWQQYRSLVCSD